MAADILAAEENASRGTGIALRMRIRNRYRRRGAARPIDWTRFCTNPNCGTRRTSLWRRGPLGPQTLCNACGICYWREQRRADHGDAASSNNGVPANGDASSSSVSTSPAVSVKVDPAASAKEEPSETVKVEPAASVKVEPSETVKVEPAASVKEEPSETVKVEPSETVKVEPAESVKEEP